MNTDDNCKDFTKNSPGSTVPLQVQESALPESLGVSLQLADAEPEEDRHQNWGGGGNEDICYYQVVF